MPAMRCAVLLPLLMMPRGATAQSAPPEMVAQDAPATFSSKVQLVLVPAVVRDSQGRPVGDLRREDFQLLDRGKPQAITSFTVEKTEARKPGAAAPDASPDVEHKDPAVAPDRFVAYLFDDIHLEFGDLGDARKAADRHLDKSLEPGSRAAIFTTSGRTTLDFTDNRAKLHETLLRLRPRSLSRSAMAECPDLSYYMADLIANKNDQQALKTAIVQVHSCNPNDPRPDQTALTAARRMVSAGEHETRLALGAIKDVIRRVAAMPGRRTVVLVSSGFLTPDNTQEKADILDRATRASVIVSALDARGVYNIGVDASEGSSPGDPETVSLLLQYKSMGAVVESAVLAEMADGTGGTFVQNTNDLEGGFDRTAARPQYYYVLGFSPQNLKLDGRFHALKVTLPEHSKLSLQARRGYYAPTHMEDAAEQTRQEIEEAMFSRDEMHELPVEMQTQFFQTAAGAAKLSVVAHVDLKDLKFAKVDGRNGNVLRVITGLFDRDGKYITAIQKVITLRFRDETLAARQAAGITVKTSFDVKPGSYVIRLIARDAEGQLMTAENGSVEIP